MSQAIFATGVEKRFYSVGASDLLEAILVGRRPAQGFQALAGIDLAAPHGAFLGLLGRNGAGKSTLLRTIAGVYPATAGIVNLSEPPVGVFELGVAGKETLTGRQFAERWLRLSGVDPTTLIDDIADFAEIDFYFDRPIRSYSSGMKARLYFAVATAPPGRIYLIDEVLSVGDAYFSAKCWRRIRARLAEGASGLFATHAWTGLMRLCAETLIIDQGRIVDGGPTAEVVRRYLNLPPNPKTRARFATLPTGVEAVSGSELVLRFRIVAEDAGEALVGVSVEQFPSPFGWEHWLHRDPTPLRLEAGENAVTVIIPAVPLVAGEYAINLFLSWREAGSIVAADSAGWLHGGAIPLRVNGPVGVSPAVGVWRRVQP